MPWTKGTQSSEYLYGMISFTEDFNTRYVCTISFLKNSKQDAFLFQSHLNRMTGEESDTRPLSGNATSQTPMLKLPERVLSSTIGNVTCRLTLISKLLGRQQSIHLILMRYVFISPCSNIESRTKNGSELRLSFYQTLAKGRGVTAHHHPWLHRPCMYSHFVE